MSTIQRARLYDQEEHLSAAFESYLAAIELGEAGAEDYIAASFLGFIFQDFGVSRKLGIPDATVDDSREMMKPLLDLCERRFGASEEIEFWRKYYDLILEGRAEFDEYCQNYLSRRKRVPAPVTEKERYLGSLERNRS